MKNNNKGRRICSWSHTHKQDKVIGEADFDQDTHGICKECAEIEREKIREYKKERKQ